MSEVKVENSYNTIFIDPRVAAEAARKFAKKASPISKNDALKIGKEYASLIRAQVDPDALIYIFGSTVSGKAHNDSDIDIAVVSKTNDAAIYDAFANLSILANTISWDIEVHAVATTDWKKGDPHILEIKNRGIPV